MATLTTTELLDLRHRAAARAGVTVFWTKAQIHASLQAIEDAVQSTANVGGKSLKTYLAQVIEAAAPGLWTAQQKDELFSIWCRFNAARGGVI